MMPFVLAALPFASMLGFASIGYGVIVITDPRRAAKQPDPAAIGDLFDKRPA